MSENESNDLLFVLSFYEFFTEIKSYCIQGVIQRIPRLFFMGRGVGEKEISINVFLASLGTDVLVLPSGHNYDPLIC